MWAITDSTAGTALHKVSDTHNFRLHSDGSNFLYDQTDTGGFSVACSGTIITNQWTLLGVSFSSNDAVLYVNNVQINSTSNTGTFSADTSTTDYSLTIGNNSDRTTENWSGSIYQV